MIPPFLYCTEPIGHLSRVIFYALVSKMKETAFGGLFLIYGQNLWGESGVDLVWASMS